MGLALSETLEFAFRRRYLMPPADPRFLAATHEDIVTDFWAHRFWDDPKLRNEIVNEDFDADLDEMEREISRGEPSDWEPIVSDTYGE